MLHRRTLLCGAAAALGLVALPLAAAEPVKIGEINSYSRFPGFTLSYQKGWQLAVEEVNAKGGVMGGRPLEVLSRDDGGESSNAVTLANELVAGEDVALLCGTFLSNIGLAVSDFAKQKEVLFIAAEPLSTKLTWEQGNRYTWRLRPSTYMQNAMLAKAAAGLDATRWATIAPNYEYGQSAVAEFKKLLKELRPDAEFVEEQWPALGKLEAGPTVQALAAAEPEAIYNATFAGDLVKFVREGTTRGLFEGREVISLLTGEPEYLDPLGAEAPEGWLVTGYPWAEIDTPAHQAFLEAFQAKWNEPPKLGAVVGYCDDPFDRGDARQGGLDRHRRDDRRDGRSRGRHAVRADHLARDRPPGDHGRLRRPDRGRGRPRHDGRLALRRRHRGHAERRGGRGDAPLGLVVLPARERPGPSRSSRCRPDARACWRTAAAPRRSPWWCRWPPRRAGTPCPSADRCAPGARRRSPGS